ncbi:MAG TPA: DUF374 domain-containing protein [Rickettsiales bacterium]|nr:DUF374 domain-containing protein [Rickettsiales bacterium]
MDIDELALPYLNGDLPAIFSFWHGSLLMMAMICPKANKTHAIISTHHDGEIIARTIQRFGIDVIRGSTTRGGAKAAAKAIRALRAGEHIVITPDGPKGPRMKVQTGVIDLARLANVPVICIACHSSRHRLMSSWDKFMVVFPFGAIYYRVSSPLANPTSATLEACMVEQLMA